MTMVSLSDTIISVVQQLRDTSLAPDEHLFSTRILTNGLLYDLIFAALSPRALLRLSRTCRTAHAAVVDYAARVFNINRHLARFFDDPLAFRSLQARTACLVSGSSALQFFDRVLYEDSDLDMYVSRVHRKEVGRWLLEHEYKFKPNSVQDPDFEVAVLEEREGHGHIYYNRMKGVLSVLTFTKPTPLIRGKDLKVQVIVATECPMEAILGFHSTVVLNLISWDRAYSLYPLATFEHRKSIFLHRRHSRFEAVITKYTSRGYTFDFSVLPDNDSAIGFSPRWIGDRHSWVIELPVNGVTRPPPTSPRSRPLTRDPCYATSWSLQTLRNRPLERLQNAGHVRMRIDNCVTERNNAFFYQYVIADIDTAFSPLKDIYRKWAHDCDASNEPGGLFGYYDQNIIEYCDNRLEKAEDWRHWRQTAVNARST